jgi:hypothetical protein
MAIGSADYETFAWWLVRESIGQGLRQRYAVAKELPPSSSTPFSKLDVLRVISCYAQARNTSDAGEMPIITKRGLKGHDSSFDPQSLVLIEKAFDEAWLTLKFVGNKTVKPDELARSVLRVAMEGERDPARLHDRALERDCYPRPPGARRADRAVVV